MNTELMEALELLEKEKNINKSAILESIQNSLLSACKSSYGTSDNCEVLMNDSTGEYTIIQKKEVVESIPTDATREEKATMISLEDARKVDPTLVIGDIAQIKMGPREFGRIMTGVAKNVILQKIREEERRAIFNDYYEREGDVITGIVQRRYGNNISINLGKCDGVLGEAEQVPTENYKQGDRIKVYVVEVKEAPKGPRIQLSRTRPDLVRRLFEQEVAEMQDGTVSIMAIAREAGARSKMAVISYDENVDAVGACVGLNGNRVNSVVDELHGEKIDIINWDENPAILIENALSPAKVICVLVDEDDKSAQVIVPDYQLSLAIGREGQNARLAARLTNYKIDIKSESQARQLGLFEELGIDYQPEGTQNLVEVQYDEYGNPIPMEGYDEYGNQYTDATYDDEPYEEVEEYVDDTQYPEEPIDEASSDDTDAAVELEE